MTDKVVDTDDRSLVGVARFWYVGSKVGPGRGWSGFSGWFPASMMMLGGGVMQCLWGMLQVRSSGMMVTGWTGSMTAGWTGRKVDIFPNAFVDAVLNHVATLKG